MVRYRLDGRTATDIAAAVEREVAAGRLAPGDLLPPVRALAAELRVSPNTAAAAYRRLRDRGVVETGGRRGTRVRFRPATTARSAPTPTMPPGLRDLASGNPDPTLFPPLDAALISALGDPVRRYDRDPVDPALADAARRVLDTEGVPTQDLTVVSGALDGVERVFAARLRPGDRVAVEEPAWSHLLDLLGASGLVPEPVPLDDEGPLPDALEQALGRGCAALVVTCRAQNPLGSAVSEERADDLRQVLTAHPDVLVVEDDHAGEIAGVPLHSLAGATQRWAHVRSVGKALGPDLRLAVMTGDHRTVDAVAGRHRLGPGWVSHLLQRTVAAMWNDPVTAALLEQAAATYAARRQGLLDALARRATKAHGVSGLNIWVPVAEETAAVAHLVATGWAVTPGSRYLLRSGSAVRVTVAELRDDETAPLADALAVAASAGSGRHAV